MALSFLTSFMSLSPYETFGMTNCSFVEDGVGDEYGIKIAESAGSLSYFSLPGVIVASGIYNFMHTKGTLGFSQKRLDEISGEGYAGLCELRSSSATAAMLSYTESALKVEAIGIDPLIVPFVPGEINRFQISWQLGAPGMLALRVNETDICTLQPSTMPAIAYVYIGNRVDDDATHQWVADDAWVSLVELDWHDEVIIRGRKPSGIVGIQEWNAAPF